MHPRSTRFWAIHWFQALGSDDQAFVRHVALQRAAALVTTVAVAANAAEAEDQSGAAAVHSLLLDRDDAESVNALLPRDERSVVEAALARVDRAAIQRLSSLSAYSWPADPRLAAVFRREPTLWWGRLSESE